MSNKKLGIALLSIAIAIPVVGFAEDSSGGVSSSSAGAQSSTSSSISKKKLGKIREWKLRILELRQETP